MKKLVNFKNGLIIIGLVGSTLLTSTQAVAATKEGFKNYVTDSLKIPFRSGPSYKHKISRMIRSGSAVTVLNVNDEGWARISYVTKSGNTYIGWMPSSLLQNQPIARQQLKKEVEKTQRLEQIKIQLDEDIIVLKGRLDVTQSELTDVNKAIFELKQAHTELLSISGETISIQKQSEELKQTVMRLETENNLLKEQLDQAEDVVERQWFLTGGGVLLLGMLIGLAFRGNKRKSSWGSTLS